MRGKRVEDSRKENHGMIEGGEKGFYVGKEVGRNINRRSSTRGRENQGGRAGKHQRTE